MPRMLSCASHRRLVLLAVVLSILALFFSLRSVTAQSPNLVISQAYGGAGSSGALYSNDYVEIFNRGTAAASLAGMSIQYGSSIGTGNLGGAANQLTELPSVLLQPGQYLLVAGASGTGASSIPTPDVTDVTPINLSGTAGKIALVSATTSIGCNGSSTACDAGQLALIVDLVGFGTANFFEGSAAASAASATTVVIRSDAGCTDTNDNAADFTTVAATPRNTATTPAPCGPPVDLPPTVASTTPANGAQGVAVDGDILISFSEPVYMANSLWFDIVCTTSNINAGNADVNLDDQGNFSINPYDNLTVGETCTATVFAVEVVDLDADTTPMESDYVFTFDTIDYCPLAYTPIPEIQGSGLDVAITEPVSTMGVVIADYQGADPALGGFYLQDAEGDGSPATSDGIFVFSGNGNTVSLGDLVRVAGTPTEFQGQSQISNVTFTTVCGTGTVAPVNVTLPAASPTDFERYEGMLVTLPQTLYLTEHFQLGRFNQVVVSADARQLQPTHVYAPGPEAATLQTANNLNRIILDDAFNSQNPDPITFGRNGESLSATNTLRGGDTITGVKGVMTYTWAGNAASGNAWRVRPTGTEMPDFQAVNERPAPIARTTDFRVTALNLLNFFNSFGNACTEGVAGETIACRGASDDPEFLRQIAKSIPALLGTDADIIAISEIENDGYGSSSAIQRLVDEMNAVAGADTWAFIDADAGTGEVNSLGTDAIKVGIIYKPATVTPVGTTAALNTVAFVSGGDDEPRNRPALAQTFEFNAIGAQLTVVSNHFKSRSTSSPCDMPDAGDGQGNCNHVRTNAANELLAWLATYPTGIVDDDVLILGDLNSYAMEDPIAAIKNAGYVDLAYAEEGSDAYSYVFDGQWGHLDYALASASLVEQVENALTWHINADEPSILDYNIEFKSTGQQTSLYAANEFRVSDHDPVLVDLALDVPTHALTVTVSGSGGGVVTSVPAGIDCGADCTETLVHGTEITLTAAANTGSTFAGWSGDCNGTDDCVVTLNAAKNVTATFTLKEYALTVTTDGTGSGSVTSNPAGSTFTHGTVVTLTAAADIGSTFTSWSGACGGTDDCAVTMDAARNVTATFTLDLIIQHPLSVVVHGEGSGSVTSTPAGIDCGTDCNESFASGTVITLTATANTGSTFAGWSGDCDDVAVCVVTMDSARSVTASFTLDPIIQHLLTVATDGAGDGVVTSNPTGIDCGVDCTLMLEQGTVITLTATANDGSTFAGWSGACHDSAACVLTMDAAQSVTATFTLNSYPIDPPAEMEGGSILIDVLETVQAAAVQAEYPYGTQLRLTAVPDQDYFFAGWTGSLASFGTRNPIIITVTGPLDINATFEVLAEMDHDVFLPTVSLNQ